MAPGPFTSAIKYSPIPSSSGSDKTFSKLGIGSPPNPSEFENQPGPSGTVLLRT